VSTYELDDDLVREFVADTASKQVWEKLISALGHQLPLPVPTKIGAVVRTDGGVFVRVRVNNTELTEWTLANAGAGVGGDVTATENLGRITQVLSEGVDL
jgi:hypothetical protein